MRIVGGLLLLVVGFTGAAYYTLPPVDVGPAPRLTNDNPAERAPVAVRVGRFAGDGTGADARSSFDVPRPELAVRSPDKRGGAVYRSAGREATTLAAPAESRRPFTAAPLTEAARWELARDLQRELKRVGCYWGEVDGSWGVGSKRAVGTFMHRVNANLPFEQPDYVILELVKAQAGTVCGACANGETLAEDGRCLPRVIVARNNRKLDKPQVAAGDAKVAEPRQFAEGAPARTPSAAWSATVRQAPEAESAAAVPPPASDLPGKMAVGARTANERFESVGLPPRSIADLTGAAIEGAQGQAAERPPSTAASASAAAQPQLLAPPRFAPPYAAGSTYATPRLAPPAKAPPRWARSFFSNIEVKSR